MQPILIVVAGHAGAELVVPTVHTADQIVPLDRAVGEKRPAMQTASVEHRMLVAEPNDHQVDGTDQHPGGPPI